MGEEYQRKAREAYLIDIFMQEPTAAAVWDWRLSMLWWLKDITDPL
jgi:hypothetical protein